MGKWVALSAADCTVELCRWSSGHARCQLYVLKGSKDKINPVIQDQLGSNIFRQVELFPEIIWQLQTMILPGCKHLIQGATPLRGD